MVVDAGMIQLAEPALILAALLLTADCLLLGLGFSKNLNTYLALVLGVILAIGLTLVAYEILTLAFTGDAFFVQEVFSSSSSGLSGIFKIGNPWIGSSGSLLFVTVLLSLVYGAYRLQGYTDRRPFRITTYMIMDILTVFFIIVTLIKSPFLTFPGTPIEGEGLNPLLQSPWVLLHPPVIFLGYVMVFFAFALMLARVLTDAAGRREARELLRLPLSVAWLLLTAGIALGALWSYQVLGWGGYWAWDPVETASLLPWLALTIYFHLPDRQGDRSREFMVLITFCMVLFSTALTRGGFAESVHAFGESPVGLVFLCFAAVVFFLVLVFLLGTRAPQEVPPQGTPSLSTISRSFASWSLIALLIVCFAGTAAPAAAGSITGQPLAIGPEFFTLLCYPFTLVFVAALIGCNASLKPGNYAVLMAATLIAGVLLAFFGIPTAYPLADFGLPLLAAAGIILSFQWLRTCRIRQFSLFSWGKAGIHLAVVIILLGVFISSAAQTESPPVVAGPGSELHILGTEIVVHGITVSPATGTSYFSSHELIGPEYSRLIADISVSEGDTTRRELLMMSNYLNYGVVSEPLILSTPAKDIYISAHQTGSSNSALIEALRGEETRMPDVTIIVRYVPLIWLVWLGILLMGAGMLAIIAGELHRGSNGIRNNCPR